MKKYILILTLGSLLLGLAGYFILVSQNKAPLPSPLKELMTRTLNQVETDTSFTPSGENARIPDETAQSPLKQISPEPVAGFTILDSKENMVLYVDRATGNFFEASVTEPTPTRLSNTTIPRIQEAYFTEDGSRVALQYLDDNNQIVKTYVVATPESSNLSSSEGGIGTGIFLPDNISTITSHPTNPQFFYVVETPGGAVGFVFSPNGTKQQVFSSPIRAWNAQYTTTNTIALTTKPSSLSQGFLYTLNVGTQNVSRVAGYLPGLKTLASPDGKSVLYSQSAENAFTLHILNPATTEARPLPVQTLSDKCVWSSSDTSKVYCGVPRTVTQGNYPDLWYQGAISFQDDLWEIDTKEDRAELIGALDHIAQDAVFDIVDLKLSSDNDYLVFKNKRDGSLWSFDLPETE